MAVPVVAITGKVLTPDGVGAVGGTIVVTLSSPGSVEDSGVGTQRIAAVKATSIALTGAVSFSLVPNDVITPSGTVYRVDYRLQSGATWTEYWDVASSPSTLEIGDVTLGVAAVSGREAAFPSVSALPTPSLSYRGRVIYVPGGTGVADAAYICLKGADESYSWVLIGIGG